MIRLFLLVVFALVAGLPARAEGAVILAVSDGDGTLAPGREIAANDVLTVPAGATVTLIREDGEIIRVDGPFSGVVEPAVTEVEHGGEARSEDWEALGVFLTGSGDADSALGAVRHADRGADFPVQADVWAISVDSSGPRCARPGALSFRRRDARAAVRFSVRADTARSGDIAWAKGEHVLRIDDGFRLADGRMVVSLDDTVRSFTLSVLPDEMADAAPGRILVWLVGRKCTRQARAMIDALHRGRSPADTLLSNP